ncbi:MAG: EVE domain-containing protein [Bacteroidota bacterium]|nr:EVE domain-containing protein [Bacteroidota bacterium]
MASWIFQGNSKLFDIDNYLNDNKIIWWAINQKQFIKKMKVGDDAYLWRSISKSHIDGGIIGHGIIIGEPQIYTSDDLQRYFFEKKRSEAKLRIQIAIDSFQIEPPKVSRQILKADSLLKDLSILSFANATNFELTKYQSKRIYDLYFGSESAFELTGDEDAIEFPEGKIAYAVHRKRERNSKLIKEAKSQEYKKNGKLICKVCGFDFSKAYGKIGDGYIEAHHSIPVSELNEDSLTRIEDVILVCSNCHRMLHRRRPWLTINELTDLLKR